MEDVILIGILCVLLALTAILGVRIFFSPFHYPYYKQAFDLHRGQKADIHDFIDRFLSEHWEEIEQHHNQIRAWKGQCMSKISAYHIRALGRLRKRQFQAYLDDSHAFQFTLQKKRIKRFRKQGTDIPYTVIITAGSFSCSYRRLAERKRELEFQEEQKAAAQVHEGHVSVISPHSGNQRSEGKKSQEKEPQIKKAKKEEVMRYAKKTNNDLRPAAGKRQGA